MIRGFIITKTSHQTLSQKVYDVLPGSIATQSITKMFTRRTRAYLCNSIRNETKPMPGYNHRHYVAGVPHGGQLRSHYADGYRVPLELQDPLSTKQLDTPAVAGPPTTSPADDVRCDRCLSAAIRLATPLDSRPRS